MSIAATPSAMQSSTQRTIPLRCREDLRFHRILYRGEPSWVCKDPVALKYYRLQAPQRWVLDHLDGNTNLEELKDGLTREFPTLLLTLADVEHLVTDLHEKGLVFTNRTGQGAFLLARHRKNRFSALKQKFMNIMYFKLPGWDPDRVLTAMTPYVAWVFRPWAVALYATIVVLSWGLLLIDFEEFRRRLPEFQTFFSWSNLFYLWITLGAAKVIHEFGHGISCKYYGSECHDMGMLLLVFSPCLYCDVSDSWTLKNKWQRIIIGGAGMYIEVFLSAVAIFTWYFTQPGMLHHLALNIFFVTTITTVIFNANPLLRFDGYYMLADLLEIPNMRQKAERMLRETFAWYCLGIETPADPFMPEGNRLWFILFTIASAIYRWFILLAITLFLYTVLKPYGLETIGLMLGLYSVVMMFVIGVRNIYQIIAAPRIEPMSIPKTVTTSVIAISLLAGFLMIPIPWHIVSTAYIEPHQVQHIYSAVPGTVTEILVQPGDFVSKGMPLMQLTNREKEDRYRELISERDVQTVKASTYHALDDVAQKQLALEALTTINEQIADFEQQLESLTIIAPCDGRVVAAESIEPLRTEVMKERLGAWHGHPLEARNLGATLPERTHVLSIAPNESFQAVLFVDQANRNDVWDGQEVEVRLEHMLDQSYFGNIESISDRHLEFAPAVVSTKMGGDLPTVTDSDGRERLSSRVYQALVLLDDDVELLRSGLRGQARVSVPTRTVAQWIWRYVTRTFHFRM